MVGPVPVPGPVLYRSRWSVPVGGPGAGTGSSGPARPDERLGDSVAKSSGMLRRLLSRRGAAAASVAASAFAIRAQTSSCKSVDLEQGTVDTLKAVLGTALAKPAHVRAWIEKQGEHAWLEDVLGSRALEWVRARNDEVVERHGDLTASPLWERMYAILTSKEKIPGISKIGDEYYNFWTDSENPRGVLRKTSLESYRAGTPEWTTVLSVDALNVEEGESWVYKGSNSYRPRDGSAPTRTLVELSRGGADAVVVREFDLTTMKFVPESEGGFVVPEAKTRVSWLTRDSLLVGTDFGDGKSLTDSGYPRTIREWQRGTPLLSAVETYTGEATDVSISGCASPRLA